MPNRKQDWREFAKLYYNSTAGCSPTKEMMIFLDEITTKCFWEGYNQAMDGKYNEAMCDEHLNIAE